MADDVRLVGLAAGRRTVRCLLGFTDILRSGLPDDDTHIVNRERRLRDPHAFPYATAHTLEAPYREVADLEELTVAEHSECVATVTDA